MQKHQRVQNSSVRITSNTPRFENIDPVRQSISVTGSTGILLDTELIKEICLLVYKIMLYNDLVLRHNKSLLIAFQEPTIIKCFTAPLHSSLSRSTFIYYSHLCVYLTHLNVLGIICMHYPTLIIASYTDFNLYLH